MGNFDALGYRGATCVVTGSFVRTDQGFASGVFTGAINPSFMMGAAPAQEFQA